MQPIDIKAEDAGITLRTISYRGTLEIFQYANISKVDIHSAENHRMIPEL